MKTAALILATLAAPTGHYIGNDLGTPFTLLKYTADLAIQVDDSVCPHARIGTDLTWDPINFTRLRVTSLQPCTLVPVFANGFE